MAFYFSILSIVTSLSSIGLSIYTFRSNKAAMAQLDGLLQGGVRVYDVREAGPML